MLIKEFKHGLKKVLNIFIVFLIIPLIFFILRLFPVLDYFSLSVKDYIDIIVFFLWVIILLSSILLGTSAFESERKNNAFEYMLTFPVKKLKLIFYKFFPRLLILFSLIIVYEIFYHFSFYFIKTSLFKPLYFPILIILLFILSFSFSLFEIRDTMALIVFFTYIGIFSLAFFFKRHLPLLQKLHYVSPFFSGFILSLFFFDIFTILGIIFTFLKFDLSPVKMHMKKFSIYLIIPILLSLISLFIKRG